MRHEIKLLLSHLRYSRERWGSHSCPEKCNPRIDRQFIRKWDGFPNAIVMGSLVCQPLWHVPRIPFRSYHRGDISCETRSGTGGRHCVSAGSRLAILECPLGNFDVNECCAVDICFIITFCRADLFTAHHQPEPFTEGMYSMSTGIDFDSF